jgi:hypothetical protein
MYEHLEQDFLKNGYLLGFRFLEDGATKVFVCKILSQEPANYEYSFGTVSATTATDFVEIKDGTRYVLVPETKDEVKHVFYGISPSRVRIYYKLSDRDRWSMFATRSVGSAHGYKDGLESPYRCPSLSTRLFVVKDISPYFAAYNPLSVDVEAKLNFVGRRYRVKWIDADKIPKELWPKVRIEDIGGLYPVEKPAWLDVRGKPIDEVNV